MLSQDDSAACAMTVCTVVEAPTYRDHQQRWVVAMAIGAFFACIILLGKFYERQESANMGGSLRLTDRLVRYHGTICNTQNGWPRLRSEEADGGDADCRRNAKNGVAAGAEASVGAPPPLPRVVQHDRINQAALLGRIKACLTRKDGGRTSRTAALFVIGTVLSLAVGRSAAARGPEAMSGRATTQASAGLARSVVPTCISFVIVSTFAELQSAVVDDGACIDVREDITFPTTLTIDVSVRIASSANATLDGGGSTELFVVYGDLALDDLTLAHGYDRVQSGAVYVETGGRLGASGCTFKSCASLAGGAVYNYGTADLSRCIFVDNAATGVFGVVRLELVERAVLSSRGLL